jgi:hypothetical protein
MDYTCLPSALAAILHPNWPLFVADAVPLFEANRATYGLLKVALFVLIHAY